MINHIVYFARNNLNGFLSFLNQPCNRVVHPGFNGNCYDLIYGNGSYYTDQRVFTTCQHISGRWVYRCHQRSEQHWSYRWKFVDSCYYSLTNWNNTSWKWVSSFGRNLVYTECDCATSCNYSHLVGTKQVVASWCDRIANTIWDD